MHPSYIARYAALDSKNLKVDTVSFSYNKTKNKKVLSSKNSIDTPYNLPGYELAILSTNFHYIEEFRYFIIDIDYKTKHEQFKYVYDKIKDLCLDTHEFYSEKSLNDGIHILGKLDTNYSIASDKLIINEYVFELKKKCLMYPTTRYEVIYGPDVLPDVSKDTLVLFLDKMLTCFSLNTEKNLNDVCSMYVVFTLFKTCY